MENRYCEYCGSELKPAPARFDGEPTFVGYLPCNCKEESSPHFHHWDSGAFYSHSHKGGKIPHGHHGSRYGFGDTGEQIRRFHQYKPRVQILNSKEVANLWQSGEGMIKDPISVKCGNCGVYRMKRDNIIEQCPNCGDDEYEFGGNND